jgi:hypothetical protein
LAGDEKFELDEKFVPVEEIVVEVFLVFNINIKTNQNINV